MRTRVSRTRIVVAFRPAYHNTDEGPFADLPTASNAGFTEANHPVRADPGAATHRTNPDHRCEARCPPGRVCHPARRAGQGASAGTGPSRSHHRSTAPAARSSTNGTTRDGRQRRERSCPQYRASGRGRLPDHPRNRGRQAIPSAFIASQSASVAFAIVPNRKSPMGNATLKFLSG